MEDLEQQLRNALARKDAPEWFEAKVMAAAQRLSRPVRRPMMGFRFALWQWASALAIVLLIAGGLQLQHQRALRERAAGEAAKARLEVALRITSAKLHKIEQKIDEMGRNN